MTNTYKTKAGEEIKLTSSPRYGSCGVRASYAAARDEAGRIWKVIGHYISAGYSEVAAATKYDME
jgi:hypothetical protein